MSFPQVVVLLSAVPFAGVGLAFLVSPDSMAALIGLSLPDATAQADIRAVYGGLQLGCAGFLVYCAVGSSFVRPGLVAQLTLYSGLFLARLYSYAVSGLPSSIGYALHAGEAIGVVFGVAAWLALNRSSASAAQQGVTADVAQRP